MIAAIDMTDDIPGDTSDATLLSDEPTIELVLSARNGNRPRSRHSSSDVCLP